jgi:hypothetical protein
LTLPFSEVFDGSHRVLAASQRQVSRKHSRMDGGHIYAGTEKASPYGDEQKRPA